MLCPVDKYRYDTAYKLPAFPKPTNAPANKYNVCPANKYNVCPGQQIHCMPQPKTNYMNATAHEYYCQEIRVMPQQRIPVMLLCPRSTTTWLLQPINTCVLHTRNSCNAPSNNLNHMDATANEYMLCQPIHNIIEYSSITTSQYWTGSILSILP